MKRKREEPPAKFVINPIAYASGIESPTSSDDSDVEHFTFDSDEPFPYSTTSHKNPKKPNGFVPKKPKILAPKNDDSGVKSQILQPLLDKLQATGLEPPSRQAIEDIASMSMCLNRPLSLSTRKNNLLKKELAAEADSPIKHLKFGVFWEFQWYNQKGKKVQYSEVQKFYKKLKKYDPKKADAFREKTETGIGVPYQQLREIAKNHENTKKLIKSAREKGIDKDKNIDLYLSFIDSDTVSFNGIYSAYLRIHHKFKPTVMSTGYEFSKEKSGDHPFVEGSKFDRQIRVTTAKHFPEGTYYPEPNFCVKVLPDKETVEESFVDPKRGSGLSLESPILLSNIRQKRDKTVWVFSDDNPLITSIPDRARKTKNKKSLIKFSEEFSDGGKPTEKDIRQFDQISQSKTAPLEFAQSLYYNKGFKIKGNSRKFNGLVKKLLECPVSEEEQNIKELKKYVSGTKQLEKLTKAILAVKHEKSKYGEENVRDPNTKALYNYLESIGKKIKDYKPEFLKIIANDEILKLLKAGTLELEELAEKPIEFLKDVLYNNEVLDMLVQAIDLDQVEELYNDGVLDDLLEITDSSNINDAIELLALGVSIDDINNAHDNDYDISTILTRFKENKLHLQFMAGDPSDIVLENYDRPAIVRFAQKYYDVDIQFVREALYGDGEAPSVALLAFDAEHEPPDEEDHGMYCAGDISD